MGRSVTTITKSSWHLAPDIAAAARGDTRDAAAHKIRTTPAESRGAFDGHQGLEHGANGLQRENDLYACIILSLRVGGMGYFGDAWNVRNVADEQLPVAVEGRKASGYKSDAPAAECIRGMK